MLVDGRVWNGRLWRKRGRGWRMDMRGGGGLGCSDHNQPLSPSPGALTARASIQLTKVCFGRCDNGQAETFINRVLG